MFFATLCNAQTLPKPLPPAAADWKRIYIKDVGSFDLPPTMEVQSEKYRTFFDKVYKLKYYETPQLVAQPINTNNLVKESLEKYARVLIETTVGKQGEYEKLNFNISDYTQTDISELNVEMKQICQQTPSSHSV